VRPYRLHQILRAPIVHEVQPVAQSPQRRRSRILPRRVSLRDLLIQRLSHPMDRQIRGEVVSTLFHCTAVNVSQQISTYRRRWRGAVERAGSSATRTMVASRDQALVNQSAPSGPKVMAPPLMF
jgi:hypothetical protein